MLQDDKLRSVFLQPGKPKCFPTLGFVCLLRHGLFICRKSKRIIGPVAGKEVASTNGILSTQLTDL